VRAIGKRPEVANRRSDLTTTWLALVTVLIVALSAGLIAVIERRGSSGPHRTSEGLHELDADRRRRAEMIVTIFETGMPTLNYGYTEALRGGQGMRAGGAGFSSLSGDLLLVTQRYLDRRPDAALAAYLPTLQELAAGRQADESAQDGFTAAWAAASDDPVMHEVQNGLVDELYYRPAMAQAAHNGMTLPLTLATLFDTMVAGRGRNDGERLQGLITETNSSMDGNPADGIDEVSWLRRFLEVGRSHLSLDASLVTSDAMAGGVDRTDAFGRLLDQGAVQLDAPLEVEAVGKWFSFS